MLSDPELSALFDQAARNLYALEVLVRASGERDDGGIMGLRRRLLALRKAYTVETNELTREVLARAVERRLRPDRRRREVAVETT